MVNPGKNKASGKGAGPVGDGQRAVVAVLYRLGRHADHGDILTGAGVKRVEDPRKNLDARLVQQRPHHRYADDIAIHVDQADSAAGEQNR